MISFTAYGIPAPKGSMKAFFRHGMRFPVVTEDNRHTRPWAAIVTDAAIDACDRNSTISGIRFPSGIPIILDVRFYLPRPQSLPRRVWAHCKKPDLDKLTRAVGDALKGVVWHDDSQVVRINASKGYVLNVERPRAEITVIAAHALPAEQALAEIGAI